MKNPLEGIKKAVDKAADEVRDTVQDQVIRGPLGMVLGGSAGGNMQKVVHVSGFSVQLNDEGTMPARIVLELSCGDMSHDDAKPQATKVGELCQELAPLFASFTDGVTPEEVVEVATELPALQGINPNLRKALVGLAENIHNDLADGHYSGGEAVTTFIAFAKTAVGL